LSHQNGSPSARRHFAEYRNILELSAISLSEIAIKAARGKLKVSAVDTRRALEDLDLRVLPYTANHAFSLFDLPLLHADPFDRQIIAQALVGRDPGDDLR